MSVGHSSFPCIPYGENGELECYFPIDMDVLRTIVVKITVATCVAWQGKLTVNP
ncbi:hypothetical protein [Viscerimonas tarda]